MPTLLTTDLVKMACTLIVSSAKLGAINEHFSLVGKLEVHECYSLISHVIDKIIILGDWKSVCDFLISDHIVYCLHICMAISLHSDHIILRKA